MGNSTLYSSSSSKKSFLKTNTIRLSGSPKLWQILRRNP